MANVTIINETALETLLYLLARDRLPIGAIEADLQKAIDAGGKPVAFSNPHLHAWACDVISRLQG